MRVSLGRRKIRIDQPEEWVFNRMADVYGARPAYPAVLIDALADLRRGSADRVADIGAGIGHIAVPLAERGCEVIAIEPAERMLEHLRAAALSRELRITAQHATAEALPLPTASIDVAIVADAIHFLDKELAALEIARVLAPAGALAIVTSEFADTPFMRRVTQIMEDAAPRRPRPVAAAISQIAAVARTPWTSERRFYDATPVDRGTLERILRSISFIGPAMNKERFTAFMRRVDALAEAPVWARQFTLRAGRRLGGARSAR